MVEQTFPVNRVLRWTLSKLAFLTPYVLFPADLAPDVGWVKDSILLLLLILPLGSISRHFCRRGLCEGSSCQALGKSSWSDGYARSCMILDFDSS